MNRYNNRYTYSLYVLADISRSFSISFDPIEREITHPERSSYVFFFFFFKNAHTFNLSSFFVLIARIFYDPPLRRQRQNEAQFSRPILQIISYHKLHVPFIARKNHSHERNADAIGQRGRKRLFSHAFFFISIRHVVFVTYTNPIATERAIKRRSVFKSRCISKIIYRKK